MSLALGLISDRVVVGRVDERLADLVPRLKVRGTHHCVVLSDQERRFVGLIQLGDLLARSNSGNRILGDLIAEVAPVFVRQDDSAGHVGDLFERYQLAEAVVLDKSGMYVGLITAQSVVEWSRQEWRRAQAELIAAAEEMRRAAEAKHRLIDAVSHELRTPLTPILLIASEAADDGALPTKVRTDFRTIMDNVARETELVEDLIDQADLSRGGLALHRERVDLHPLLQRLVAQAKVKGEQKGLTFLLELGTADAEIPGDLERLRQVFAKLLDNAMSFTPSGGKITVATMALDRGSRVAVRITDTGLGILPVELPRLFEPLERLVPEPGGLGLGLSIAKGLVELQQGKLEVQSAGRDQGTTLTVTFPRWTGEEKKHERARPGRR